MNTKNEKDLDAFIRQLTKEIPWEEPRDHFTDTVLGKIEANVKQPIRVVYTPLFSKVSWFLICVLAITLLLIGYFAGEQETVFTNVFSLLMERSESMPTFNLPSISNSKILLFSSLALISCFAIQIIWLKNSWAKKQVLF